MRYKIGLYSDATRQVIDTLRGGETDDRNTAYETAIYYNNDPNRRPDLCRYVVIEIPEEGDTNV